VVALIAYEAPEASPLAHLLSTAQRERVADVVNAAVLGAAAAAAAAAGGAEGGGGAGGAAAMQTEASAAAAAAVAAEQQQQQPAKVGRWGVAASCSGVVDSGDSTVQRANAWGSCI
jgi:hypothetical protein